jgi:hypothetical protein
MIRVERAADGSPEAVSEVVVGVEARVIRVPLSDTHAEVGPGGLRNTPVVVITDPELPPLVEAGAGPAGNVAVGIVEASSGDLGTALLEGARAAEVLLVLETVDGVGDALIGARALLGRPLPVLPLDRPDTVRSMLAACWIDLDIAVPSVDGPQRGGIREVAGALGLFSAHHVVEVDPRPGLGTGSWSGVGLHELAAAATGVLAGRVAAGNRRWR